MASAPLAALPVRGTIPAPLYAVAAPRREAARSPRPRVPEDFFSASVQALLSDLLKTRAAAWLADDTAPIYFYGCQSMPLWGEEAGRRWVGRSLRRAKRWTLCENLSTDLERGLRLLTLERTAEGHTRDGHTAREWRAALVGVLWRVGQVYRELARREGEARAQTALRLGVEALWR